MKKVVLLGDSIRMIGYGPKVAEQLKDEYIVAQPEENCRYARRTLRGLYDWQDIIAGADIIHWNNGLWDVCELFGDGPFTPIEEYVTTMLRLCTLLKQRCTQLIFATSTPVIEPNSHNQNSVIRAYNERIVPLLKEQGCMINDLYTLIAADIPGNIRPDDKIHLTEKGIALATEQVISCIRKADGKA